MTTRFISLFLTSYLSIFYRIILNSSIVKCDDKTPAELNIVEYKVDSIPLKYVPGTGYAVNVDVGGQSLNLLLSATTCGLMLFENTKKICFKDGKESCYDPNKSSTARWCDTNMLCVPGRFNFTCRETTSPDGIKDLTSTAVRVETNLFQIFSIEGVENVKVPMDHRRTPYTFERAPVKLARSLDRYDYKLFENVDGLFGIAGFEICCRTSLWEKMVGDYRGFFVIDINPPANVRFPSKLYLGTDRVAEEEVVWSERRQSGGIYTSSLLQFTMYDLTMCDTNLFGKTSSNWEAAIDLSTPYLVLPKNFWLTMMAYLPVDKACFSGDTHPRLCKLTNGHRLFPVLEFKMSQSYYLNFEKVDPPTIKIPLENLLHDDGVSKTIMIMPDDTRDKTPYTVNPSIKLGYKVLESFNVVVDSDGLRIGLVNKNLLVSSHSKCAEVPQCIGDQVYEPALNMCMDPLCSIWLMKRLNPDTRVCETSFIAKVLFTTIVSALILAEFYCNFARKHILRIASRLCQ